MSEDLRLRVARAIAFGVDGAEDFDNMPEEYRQEMLEGADAVFLVLGGEENVRRTFDLEESSDY